MEHFDYLNDTLYIESLSLDKIAQSITTPFYCYSSSAIINNYQTLKASFTRLNPLICFAVKANSNISILSIIAKLGGGADAVSQGEIIRALKSGIAPAKIVFSGIGKTEQELQFALEHDILQFNVESEAELQLLNQVASTMKKQAEIAFRVNPDIDGMTHHKIATGKKDSKFGIYWNKIEGLAALTKTMKYIKLIGISTHIGSQITQIKPFEQTFDLVKELIISLKKQGHPIKRVDLGGGIGIKYSADEQILSLQEYALLASKCAIDAECELILEPGRLIVGNSGVLITKVIYIKQSESSKFIVIDAGMNDLIRPSLYNALHEIIPLKINHSLSQNVEYDIVGPVCETSDIFAKQMTFSQEISAGDLLAIKTVGAYGAVMSSGYNSRLLIPEVMVDNDAFKIIRRRPTYEDMLSLEL